MEGSPNKPPAEAAGMRILRAYKTELKPNDRQRTACLKHAGTARFAYNWGLAERRNAYETEGVSLNAIALHRKLNQFKKTTLPWLYEVSKCAPQEALRDLDKAFKNFFQKRGKYPKFKSGKCGKGAFRLTGAIKVFSDAVQLPRIGLLRLKERDYIPTDAHILSATVSEGAERWYVSVLVEEEIEAPRNDGPIAGVDLGINRLATVSDGTVFSNPKALAFYERKLRRANRALSRRQKGSNNRRKAIRALQNIHARISNVRKDAQHKLTTWLAKNKSVIVIEDLNVRGMVRNRHLSRAISDAGFGALRRQLGYKTRLYGSTLVVADRFFPSSKTCSGCGHVKDMLNLSERMFKCETCGFTLDRDLNASRNLEKLAVSCTESLNACKSGRHWPPTHVGGETVHDEAGIEHGLGDVLTG